MKTAIALLFTFIFAFFIATALFDEFARQMGFYDQGLIDSLEVYK